MVGAQMPLNALTAVYENNKFNRWLTAGT